jgi:adenylate cyclase
VLRRFFRRFGWTHLIGIGILAAFVVLRGSDPTPVELLRLKVFDFYQQIKPRDPVAQPVVIIDIDEASLTQHGQWPWPRTVIADLVNKLHRAGVPAIGFDVVFAEPDRTSGASVANALTGLDEEVRAALERHPSNDRALAEVIKAGNVVLGQSGVTQKKEGVAERRSVIGQPAIRSAPGADPEAVKNYMMAFPDLVRNLEILEEAAAGIGVFTIKPAQDGIIRRVPLVTRVGDLIYPALSIELLRVAFQKPTYAVKAPKGGGIESVVVPTTPRREIPTDKAGDVWVHFAPHQPDLYVSAADVLNGTVGPERLAGHIAIVGTSAIGLRDIKATPLEEAMPGVEVHAQLIQTILANDFLNRPFWAFGAEVVALVVVGLLLIALVPFLGAVWTLLLGASLTAGLLGLSWYLFDAHGTLMDMVFVAIGAFVVYVVLTYLSYLREERERRQVRGAFSRYMSPDLVAQLADDPSKLTLGGEMRDMTLLFADIRGFTTISEQFDAEGLTRFINRYLTPMTNVILERQGTIDKYMGDCIMAFWNAPLSDDDHAKHGVRSGLAMLEESDRMNAELKVEAETENRKYIPLRIGIGLNTGECCVGNMGSEMRFDYSVLGDSVNLASRLEGQSKNYGVDIVIGESTYELVKEFACLQLDRIQVKGKTVPVNIFCVLGDETLAETEAFRDLSDRHGEMLNAYRAQDWRVMRRKITECRSLDPERKLNVLYELYTERLEEYESNPPGGDWDGVFVATSK